MKIRLKNIPKGFKLKNGGLVKTMKEGGAQTTLPPVDRDKANIEAEKNETVLTDANNDGSFELFNIGGKRHSEGGTPLNLPEQSFIFSDTRKMLLTQDEMKELGIKSKKRLTPAGASKKFPINKYMDILEDESSDKIAITSAEAMIKKNKIKLSHIAFIQEKKKNFEDGLPLAAYPYLLENGVNPQEFEAKLQEQQQQGQGPQQGQPPQQGMPPQQGPPSQGGQPSPEQMQQMMAMAQSQGAPQGPPQGSPQGIPPGMPPQGAPQGGGQEEIIQQVAQALQQGISPEEIMQQLIQMGIPEEQAMQIIQQIMQSIQGQQGPPQGMPPQGPPPQFPSPGGPPQGGMPPQMMAAMQQGAPQGGPQGPPQGGQGMPPEMMEQMMAMQQGQQGPPPGMARYGGHPLSRFVYGGDLPKGQDGTEICPCSPEFTERTGLKMHPSCCDKTSIDDKNLDFYRAGFPDFYKDVNKSIMDASIGNTTIDHINRMDNAEKIYDWNMLNRFNPSNRDSIFGNTTNTQKININPPEYIPSGPWDKTFTGQNNLLVEKYGGDLPYDKLHQKAQDGAEPCPCEGGLIEIYGETAVECCNNDDGSNLSARELQRQYDMAIERGKGNSLVDQTNALMNMNWDDDFYTSSRPRTIFGNLGTRFRNIFRSDEKDIDYSQVLYDARTGKKLPSSEQTLLNQDLIPQVGSGPIPPSFIRDIPPSLSRTIPSENLINLQNERYGGALRSFVYGGSLPKAQKGSPVCPCSAEKQAQGWPEEHPACCNNDYNNALNAANKKLSDRMTNRMTNVSKEFPMNNLTISNKFSNVNLTQDQIDKLIASGNMSEDWINRATTNPNELIYNVNTKSGNCLCQDGTYSPDCCNLNLSLSDIDTNTLLDSGPSAGCDCGDGRFDPSCCVNNNQSDINEVDLEMQYGINRYGGGLPKARDGGCPCNAIQKEIYGDTDEACCVAVTDNTGGTGEFGMSYITQAPFNVNDQDVIYSSDRSYVDEYGRVIPISPTNMNINDYSGGVMYNPYTTKTDEFGNLINTNIWDKGVNSISNFFGGNINNANQGVNYLNQGVNYLQNLLGLKYGGGLPIAQNGNLPEWMNISNPNPFIGPQPNTNIQGNYDVDTGKFMEESIKPYGQIARYGGSLPSYQPGGQPLVNNVNSIGNVGEQIMNSGQSLENQKIAQLTEAQRNLLAQREQIVMAVQSNPEKFNNEEAQAELATYMTQLDASLQDVSQQLQLLTEKQFLKQTTIPLNEFIGETSENAIANSDQYFNPDLLMASNGVEVTSNDDNPYSSSFTYRCQGHSCNDVHDFSVNSRVSGQPNYTFLNTPDFYKTHGTHVSNKNATDVRWTDTEFEDRINLGTSKHNAFYNIMSQETFEGVRDSWLDFYNNAEKKGVWANKEDGTPEELFYAFNTMNNLFNMSFAVDKGMFQDVGSESNFDVQMRRNAKLLGIELPTDNKDLRKMIKQYQGMYNALATIKQTGDDATKDMLKNVDIAYSNNVGGSHIIPGTSGLRVSNIDGNVGNNTSLQQIKVHQEKKEEIEIETPPCTAAEKAFKMDECMKKGLQFNEKSCDCIPEEDDIIPEIPPYLTFPGDDLKVANLASIQRDKKYGILQNYDPIMRDPGYVDDRAQVAAITALANQAGQFSRNYSEVQATAQDKIDQVQANRWATNTKIFDNTQAYNVDAINKAKEKNAGYMQTYQDMVNTVDQEYDNTQIADMMNLTDAEISRMDNADKLYELNMRNPNYYFDPQKHSTIFQNAQALKAFKDQNTQGNMTYEQAHAKCKQLGYQDEAQIHQCAKTMSGSTSTNDPYADQVSNKNINNNNTENEETRYGGPIMKSGGSVPCKSCNNKGTIREKDLIESRIKLRNWITGY